MSCNGEYNLDGGMYLHDKDFKLNLLFITSVSVNICRIKNEPYGLPLSLVSLQRTIQFRQMIVLAEKGQKIKFKTTISCHLGTVYILGE